MFDFFRPGLFLLGALAVAFGIWTMVSGRGDGFGFPFELPSWMLVAGKDAAVGGIVIIVGLLAILIAALTKPPGKVLEEDPPSVSQVEPGD